MKVSTINLFFAACISGLVVVQCKPLVDLSRISTGISKITKTAKCGIHQFGEIIYRHDHHRDPCQNANGVNSQVIPMPNGNHNHGETSNQNEGHQGNHNHGVNYNENEGHQGNHNQRVTSTENGGDQELFEPTERQDIKDTNNITKEKLQKPPGKTDQSALYYPEIDVRMRDREETTVTSSFQRTLYVHKNCPEGTYSDNKGNCREIFI